MKLKDYIQGNKHGKEANRLEREALNDPFLQDALDGFNSVGGNHLDAIGRLEKELEKRIKSKEKSTDNHLWLVGIAASITLLIGFGCLFFIHNQSTDFVVAIDTDVVNQQEEVEYLSEQISQDAVELPPAKSPIIAEAKTEKSATSMDLSSDKEIVESSKMIVEAETEEVVKIADFVSDKDEVADMSFAAKQKSNSRIIKGTVVDKDGPIPMASVVVKGTSKGVITDFDGTYSIAIDEGDILAFASSGSLTQERKITKKSADVIDIYLTEDVKELAEFVVVGYGKMKKSDLTGAVGSISEDKLKESVATSIDQAMQGRVAGVAVTASTGQPGAATSVRIRGASSLTGTNEPLYVVDGMPISQREGVNPLTSINPADIVSMEVLKDTSATAIYGSRATYGVVLITTTKGKGNAATVKFGKKEFKEYFEKNRSKEICSDEKASIEVHFYIDETGTPTNLEIKKSNCNELQEELIKLLENGPEWSIKKQNVKLDIQLK
jgi:TonB-dependent SusC/RagA subfamily outer membrane receptor